MITALDELYVELQELVQTASGVPLAILADQGQTPPFGLYATYKPTPIRAIGHPRKSRALLDATEDFNESLLGADWQDFEETTISNLELMLSCNFLNGTARDAAWRMHNANFRWPIQERLWTAGIGWRNASEARDLTAIWQADYQTRWQVDVFLWIETQITDSVLRANGFSYTIEDEDGNVLYQET